MACLCESNWIFPCISLVGTSALFQGVFWPSQGSGCIPVVLLYLFLTLPCLWELVIRSRALLRFKVRFSREKSFFYAASPISGIFIIVIVLKAQKQALGINQTVDTDFSQLATKCSRVSGVCPARCWYQLWVRGT